MIFRGGSSGREAHGGVFHVPRYLSHTSMRSRFLLGVSPCRPTQYPTTRIPMNTEQTTPTRPPFKVSGNAEIKHLNVRKEGPDDEKILAVDVKLSIANIDRRLCAYFDDALEAFLWRGDTDALIVRNAYLFPVAYGNTISGCTVQIGMDTYTGCKVKKFSIEPRDGGVITLICSISLYPSASEVSDLAKFVQDETNVTIESPPDLFTGSAQ